MSACNSCGRDVTWARREQGGWNPPLTFVGMAYVVDRRGVVRYVPTYEEHRCNEAEVAARAQEKAEQAQMRLDYEDHKRAQWALAEPRPCPKCGAEPGERCMNLTILKRSGIRKDTVLPHAERVPVLPPGPDVGPTSEEPS